MPQMIQNRITTVCSAQPTISKWWCSGAILNRRLPPVSLKKPTCRITDSVMSTNMPPRITTSSSVRVRIARPATAPPRASEPESPMKILAGEAFHHRKPKQAPASAIEMAARSLGSRTS